MTVHDVGALAFAKVPKVAADGGKIFDDISIANPTDGVSAATNSDTYHFFTEGDGVDLKYDAAKSFLGAAAEDGTLYGPDNTQNPQELRVFRKMRAYAILTRFLLLGGDCKTVTSQILTSLCHGCASIGLDASTLDKDSHIPDAAQWKGANSADLDKAATKDPCTPEEKAGGAGGGAGGEAGGARRRRRGGTKGPAASRRRTRGGSSRRTTRA